MSQDIDAAAGPVPLTIDNHIYMDEAPLLLEYRRDPEGRLSGLLFGKVGAVEGSQFTTSAVESMSVVNGVQIARTISGDLYRLGEPHESEVAAPRERRSRRMCGSGGSGGSGSLLSSAARVENLASMLEPHGYQLECAGSGAGGTAADSVLQSSFAHLDPAVVNLTGQYASAERAVLFHDGQVAAVTTEPSP